MKPWRLVVSKDGLAKAFEAGTPLVLWGHVRDQERLIQILDVGGEPPALYRNLGVVAAAEDPLDGLLVDMTVDMTADMTADVPVDVSVDGRLARLTLRERPSTPIEVTCVDVHTEFRARHPIDGDGESIYDKTVLLVGAGSVGSLIGLQLAQAGAARFIVIDNGVFEAPNLSRHACDLADLGREKSVAVADQLGRRLAKAAPITEDVLEMMPARLAGFVRDADLVVASTDSTAVQFLVNEACVREKRPALFIGAWERASAGEVIAVLPGGGPCFFCVAGFRAAIAPDVPRERPAVPYQDGTGDMVAEPGLAIDIASLVSVASAYALALLDPAGNRADLLRPERRCALIQSGARPLPAYADLFKQPFDLLLLRPTVSTACPVCGWAGEEGEDNGSG